MYVVCGHHNYIWWRRRNVDTSVVSPQNNYYTRAAHPPPRHNRKNVLNNWTLDQGWPESPRIRVAEGFGNIVARWRQMRTSDSVIAGKHNKISIVMDFFFPRSVYFKQPRRTRNVWNYRRVYYNTVGGLEANAVCDIIWIYYHGHYTICVCK